MTIYPAIDIREGKCVRLVQGDFEKMTTYSEDPVEVALRWQSEGARWLHVVDLDGAKEGRPSNDKTIAKIVEAVKIPVQVGGGNRTFIDIKKRFEMGVSRLVIGTAALNDQKVLLRSVGVYGEKIVVGVDALNGYVAVSAWQTVSRKTSEELLTELKDAGVKTVVYTDISKDCMMVGPNFHMYEDVADIGIDIIASGGISSMEDIARLSKIKVSGIIIGKALYVGAISLGDAIKKYC